jgi:hypothetical protein
MSATLTDVHKRQARITRLADELRRKCTANSDKARARCKAIALELVDLFRAEEIYHKHPDSTVIERAKKAVQESRQLRKASREALEVMELEKTLLSTTRTELLAFVGMLEQRLKQR